MLTDISAGSFAIGPFIQLYRNTHKYRGFCNQVINNAIKNIAVAGMLFALTACSTSTPSKEKVAEAVKKIMPVKFEVVSVVPLKEIPGVIEVSIRMDNQPVVFYMDKKAQYVISGSLLHIDSKKNLTNEAQQRIKGK